MTTLMFSGINYWFSLAITIVLAFFLVETLATLLGKSFMGIFDDPKKTAEQTASACSSFISTLLTVSGLAHLPTLLWISVLLTLFALCGYLLHGVVSVLAPALQSEAFILPVAMTSALSLASLLSGYLYRLLIADEDENYSKAFCGCVAEITIGVSRSGNPAEACFKDKYCQTHYILVEPVAGNDTFTQGEQVVLVRPDPPCWRAVRQVNEAS